MKRLWALLPALCLLCGCAPQISPERLTEEVEAALDWDWLQSPLQAAVDFGLLTSEEAQEGVSRERLAAVLEEIETRKGKPVDWLHGFYAMGSYDQLSYAGKMDTVSLGWARLRWDGGQGAWVSTSSEDGNDWYVPKGKDAALSALAEYGVPNALTVFASTSRTVTLEDGTEMSELEAAILPENQDATVAALVEISQDYQGLTVDFEGLRSADRREDFSDFMDKLREALPADKPLYAAVPPPQWYAGYDYRRLEASCDRIILMAHDYQWVTLTEDDLGSGKTDTPPAPLDQVYEALAAVLDPETGMRDPSKLVLAICFAAAGVEVYEEEDLLAGTRLYGPGPATLSARLAQTDAQRGFSQRYQTPYVFYHGESGKRYKVWYEDAQSVLSKIRLARLFGVTGISIWRLGTIPDFENYDVWTTICQEAER